MEENIRLPGTIEVYGLIVDVPASIIIYVDGITCIETIELSQYRSKIYLNGGQSIRCIESVEEIKELILKSTPK